MPRRAKTDRRPPQRHRPRARRGPAPRLARLATTDGNRPRRDHARLGRVSLVGMVHLPALSGSPRFAGTMAAIVDRAVGEAVLLARAGFDAVIVENFGDAPFAADDVPDETVAAMAVVADRVVRAVRVPVGINVLRNDALAGLAVAAATGAAFIRVNVLSGTCATDQGLITGRARELLDRRAYVAPHVLIAADVHVKHSVPINQPDIALAAAETAYRAGADVLIVSGAATGSPVDLDKVRRVKAAVPDRPVWIGSGVTAATVRECLAVADGVIVGTALKRGGKTTAPLDERQALRLVEEARKARRWHGGATTAPPSAQRARTPR